MKLFLGLTLFLLLAALLDWNWYRHSTIGLRHTCIPNHIHHPGHVERRKTETGVSYEVYFPPYNTPAPGCLPIPF